MSGDAEFWGRAAARCATAARLYTDEALEIHRLLDVAGVPRTADNEPLSMAQRVAESLRMARIARQKD